MCACVFVSKCAQVCVCVSVCTSVCMFVSCVCVCVVHVCIVCVCVSCVCVYCVRICASPPTLRLSLYIQHTKTHHYFGNCWCLPQANFDDDDDDDLDHNIVRYEFEKKQVLA